MYNFLKTTVLGGVLFLVPVVVLIAILEKALGVAKTVVVPLNDALFQGTVHHAYMGDLLALVLLLVLCFLAGLAAKTSFARKSVDALEKKLLAKVPTYDSMKSKFLATLQSQSQEGEAMRPVLARFENFVADRFRGRADSGWHHYCLCARGSGPLVGISLLHDGGSYPSYRPSDVSSDENPQRLRKRLQRTTECLFQTQIAGPVS